jgi:hypothetical protein
MTACWCLPAIANGRIVADVVRESKGHTEVTCLDFLSQSELRISVVRQTHSASGSPNCCGAVRYCTRPPCSDFAPGIGQVVEPVRIQTFIAQPTVEALDVTILHRPSRLDMDHLNFALFAPT